MAAAAAGRCCPEENSAVAWNQPPNYSSLTTLTNGPIVPGTICGAVEAESATTRHAKYVEIIEEMTTDFVTGVLCF